MGFETMRRWPVFVIFAFCMMLCLSLLSSWSTEKLLEAKLDEVTIQLQKCSKQQGNCMEESLVLVEQRDKHALGINKLEKEKKELKQLIDEINQKVLAKENQTNRTQIDVELCRTELESLKSLQVSKSTMLDTLRLEKDTLMAELTVRKEKIDEFEKEVARLKTALDGKTPANLPAMPKITPALPPVKPSAEIGAPLNQPDIVAAENNAKEDEDDLNTINENFNDFNDDTNK